MFVAVFLLTIIGVIALVSAFAPIARMMPLIGSGRMRQGWMGLSALIVAFVVGYASFLWLCAATEVDGIHLVVSMILAAGGVFVLVVAHLSYATAFDIRRLAALERDVILDPLTGIFNRRYLDARLVEEVARSQRSGSSLSAVMIDIDHFKSINDRFGHQIGDVVIRKTAELVVRTCRTDDTVVRYGGEELMILAPGIAAREAEVLAESIRTAIARLPSLVDGHAVPVTVSAGVATWNPGEVAASLVQRADNALYRAKRQGRNRVCLAPHRPGDAPAVDVVRDRTPLASAPAG
ncbi:GGDEF domain-containing protein [Methylobacterium sp. Gmos1]